MREPIPSRNSGNKAPVRPESKKTLLLLLLCTAAALAVYYAAPAVGFLEMYLVYFAVGAAAALGYVIYNRGMIGKIPEANELSDAMTPDQKREFLDTCREKRKKSRWVLFLLIPILVTFSVDMIVLFLIPTLEAIL